MNAVPLRAGAARCRMFLAGLVIAAGVLPGLPASAQEAQPRANAAEPAQNGSLPANIPVKREQTGDAAGAGNDIGWIAILAALGLIAAAVVVARRRARPLPSAHAAPGAWWSRLGGLLDAVPSREIERVSSMPLSPRHSLHVVVWNGRRLLIGCTDQSIQLLAETPGSAEAPATPAFEKEAP
jgi:flagellar protein FliO/FliZ